MKSKLDQQIVRLTRNRVIIRINGVNRAFNIQPSNPRRDRQNPRQNSQNSRPNRSRPNRGRPNRGRPNQSRPNRQNQRRNLPPPPLPNYLRNAAQMPQAQIRLKNLTAHDVLVMNKQLRRQQLIREIDIGEF